MTEQITQKQVSYLKKLEAETPFPLEQTPEDVVNTYLSAMGLEPEEINGLDRNDASILIGLLSAWKKYDKAVTPVQ